MNNSKNPKQRGLALGLLAMFGATELAGALPRLADGGDPAGNHGAPAHIQTRIIAAAKVKRMRRAESRQRQIALGRGQLYGVPDSGGAFGGDN